MKEPYNIDSYIHNTGFNITYEDQIKYNFGFQNKHIKETTYSFKK